MAAPYSSVAAGQASPVTGRRHLMSPKALDQAGKLMMFNWLVAAYAHIDWLGPWSKILAPRDTGNVRLLRRASLAMLARHNLHNRYVTRQDVEAYPWLLAGPERLNSLAQELGVAMLGGWVRTRLEREEVARQRRVLDADQRAAAMRHAAVLRALPYAGDSGWPLARLEPGAVVDLGLSCLAALLNNPQSGAQERFKMQFARARVAPLVLSDGQRQEARELIRLQLQSASPNPPQAQEPGVWAPRAGFSSISHLEDTSV